jgi:hypothetical protein
LVFVPPCSAWKAEKFSVGPPLLREPAAVALRLQMVSRLGPVSELVPEVVPSRLTIPVKDRLPRSVVPARPSMAPGPVSVTAREADRPEKSSVLTPSPPSMDLTTLLLPRTRKMSFPVPACNCLMPAKVRVRPVFESLYVEVALLMV